MLRSSTSLILAALVLLALAPAASADSHEHHLGMYKVERFQSLFGGDGVDNLKVKCDNGDYAVDGMWRVDSVDQNEDDWTPYNAVEIYRSESTAKDTWAFSIANESDGQAQIHLWVTCIGRKTAPGTHRGKLALSDRFTSTQAIPADAVWLLDAGEKTCPSGEIAVARGFASEGDAALKMFKSWPADPTMRRWVLGFYAPGDSDVSTSVRCLKLAVAGSRSHGHTLSTTFRQTTAAVAKGAVTQAQITCGDAEKGLLGAFDVRGSRSDWGADFDSHGLWYVGQEPQLKSRVFHVWNHTETASYEADFGAVCFGDRTSTPQR